MRMLLWAVGGVVLVVLLVALIGALLPKGHVARRSMILTQAPESVWAVITDFGTQSQWRKDVTKSVIVSDGPGGPVWREEGQMPLTFQTTESQAPYRLVRQIVDTDLAFGGRWVYELTADGAGTRVTVTEEGEVYNPIFRFVSHVFLNQGATIEAYLTALAARFGAPARIEAETKAR